MQKRTLNVSNLTTTQIQNQQSQKVVLQMNQPNQTQQNQTRQAPKQKTTSKKLKELDLNKLKQEAIESLVDSRDITTVYSTKGKTYKPTQKLIKKSLLTLASVSLLWGTLSPVLAQAQSPGGTKTTDRTKRHIKGVYVTGNLNKDLMQLKENKKLVKVAAITDKKETTQQTPQLTQQEVIKQKEVEHYTTSKPVAIQANSTKDIQDNVHVEPKNNNDKQKTVKTVDDTQRLLTVTNPSQNVNYLTHLYDENSENINQNRFTDAINTLYNMPSQFKSQILVSDKLVEYNGTRYYHFSTNDQSLQGYIAESDAKTYNAITPKEEPAVENRDYIEFKDDNKVVTKPVPYTTFNQDSYTVKKGTVASVVSTVTIDLPVSTKTIVTLKDSSGNKVYLDNTTGALTIKGKHIEGNSSTVPGFTDKAMTQHTDIKLSNYDVVDTTNVFIDKPQQKQYYKLQIPGIADNYYIETTQAQKQHYGFASATTTDQNIYKVNISSTTYNNPTSYKDSSVKSQLKFDTYVKAQDKVTVTNRDNTTTEWIQVTQNGQDTGYVEANKLTVLDPKTSIQATVTDTFKSIAEKYQLDLQSLKDFNPEISSIGDTSTGDIVYLYRRDNLDTVKDGYTQMQDVFDRLSITNASLKRKMIAAKTTKYDTDSKLVKQYSYIIPYIIYRGFLPSVTFGQAILESTDGNSGLATQNNNLFGIKGAYKGKKANWATSEYYDGKTESHVSDDFRDYPNGAESFKDYLDLLEKNYDAQDITDPQTAIEAIKDGGYATDPNYVDSIMNTIHQHSLTKLDTDK